MKNFDEIFLKTRSEESINKLSLKLFLTVKTLHTAQKMKFSIKDFFCKCDQIRRKQRIWSHLLKKSLMENFIFCAVTALWGYNYIYLRYQFQ